MNSKRFQRIFGFSFYALAILFLVIYAQSLDPGALAQISWNPLWLLVATVIGVATRYLFARIWLYFLSQSGSVEKVDVRELYWVYAKSWLGRYIPGSVTWVVGKVIFAARLGIAKTRLAVSSFFEGILQLLTLMLSATILLLLDPRSFEFAGQWIWTLFAVAITGILFVLPAVFRLWASFAYRLVRKSELAESLIPNSGALLGGILMFLMSSILSGLALFFVAMAVQPDLGIRDLFFVLAASNLASAISMVAVFAPAGIGVREAVQILALSVVMPVEQALVVAIAMRVMSLVWDLLFAAVAKLATR